MEKRIQQLISRISLSVLGTRFHLRFQRDVLNVSGRYFLQVMYTARCTVTDELQAWQGRKWYLSEFMTDDEIVKTAWCAFDAAIKHETMEGFKVDGKVLFNPHVNFEELLTVSHKEVTRSKETNA